MWCFITTSSNGNIFHVSGPCKWNSPVTGEFPSQRPVTQSLIFSLICTWINSWVNNREAGDLRRHHAHYDVTVMYFPSCEAIREINNKITLRVSTWTVLRDSTYITLSIAWHIEPHNHDKKMTLILRLRVSLVLFAFCWWRHNRLRKAYMRRHTWDASVWTVVVFMKSVWLTSIFPTGRARIND